MASAAAVAVCSVLAWDWLWPQAGAPALWAAMLVEVQSLQRVAQQELVAAMRGLRAGGATSDRLLVFSGFLYGVLHAAGPGHGKIVISAYLMTNESELRKGLLLSLAGAVCQGITAIVAVTVTVGLLGLSLRQAQAVSNHLESASFALLALVGLFLAASRIRRLVAGRRRAALPGHSHAHDGHCSDCGHAAVPQTLPSSTTWPELAAIIASIGFRPCSGAILVLVLAHSLDLSAAGVTAVFAMSLGSALTVSALALLSVHARRWALHIFQLPSPGNRLPVILDAVAAGGGLFLAGCGVLLLQASLTAPVHPFR